MDDKFLSRKFLFALFFSVMDTLLIGVIVISDPSSALGAFGAYIGAQATILTLYGGANVMEKKGES